MRRPGGQTPWFHYPAGTATAFRVVGGMGGLCALVVPCPARAAWDLRKVLLAASRYRVRGVGGSTETSGRPGGDRLRGRGRTPVRECLHGDRDVAGGV
jgi:hypothetical protein